MTPNMVQRHHDYVLGPNQDSRLASIAPLASLNVALTLDPDAPFLLRSRAMRVKYDSSRRQTGLNHLRLRWAGPTDFQSQNYIRQSLLAPYFGQLGNPIPVYPQVIYPRQGTIEVELLNTSTSLTLTNLTLYFRGVKLFTPGAVKAYRTTFPNFGLLPWRLPQTVLALPVGPTPYIRQTLLTHNNEPISDADFVIRSGQAGLPFLATPANEIFIRLRDEDEKPYSNDLVHIDVMFGNARMGALYPAGSSPGVAAVGTGPNSPGAFYPEIYIPRTHIMSYEVYRDDSSFGGAVAIDLPITFSGQKVFQK